MYDVKGDWRGNRRGRKSGNSRVNQKGEGCSMRAFSSVEDWEPAVSAAPKQVTVFEGGKAGETKGRSVKNLLNSAVGGGGVER